MQPYPEHIEALVRIQAAWRGYWDRELVRDLRSAAEDEDEDEDALQQDYVYHVTRLQAIRRGALVRSVARQGPGHGTWAGGGWG